MPQGKLSDALPVINKNCAARNHQRIRSFAEHLREGCTQFVCTRVP